MNNMLLYFEKENYTTKKEKDIQDKKEGRRFQIYIFSYSKILMIKWNASILQLWHSFQKYGKA